ncbi:MAG: HAD family hydrolase, partial [Candidatus Omnitrophica bacterium]|nr:HAD family hydrolase [Candidatus Omnitrophota bacterium]
MRSSDEAISSKNMEKIIFVDRDGVINVDPIGDYIKRWEDFRFEEGALDGLKSLSDAGYEIIVISNQAGVGDSIYPASELERIDRNMIEVFRQNKIRFRSSHYCHHGKSAGCKCRKPEIGLFLEATSGLEFDKTETCFIGDKISDMDAGKRFGIKTVFVLTGHGKLELEKLKKGT